MSHCADEVSCRLFLCGRCRSQVLVCRDCDRGQIYCFGTCAQDARRENQREARRRYQATPRGRAMHAARSRRYRARGQCVTDHSPPNEQKAGPFLELEVGEALSERSRSRRSPLQWLCHHCRRSASEFVRLSPLRPRRNRRKTGQIGRRGGLSVAVHPDGASQGGLPALPRFTGMHAQDCAPTAADGISPRPPFPWLSPKNVWFFTAANSEQPHLKSMRSHLVWGVGCSRSCAGQNRRRFSAPVNWR